MVLALKNREMKLNSPDQGDNEEKDIDQKVNRVMAVRGACIYYWRPVIMEKRE
jgi:hypothetical protein